MSKYIAVQFITEVPDDYREDTLDELHDLFCKEPLFGAKCSFEYAAMTGVDDLDKAMKWMGIG